MQLSGLWPSLATYRVRVALNLKSVVIPETMVDLAPFISVRRNHKACMVFRAFARAHPLRRSGAPQTYTEPK